jgi:hypothetical protein
MIAPEPELTRDPVSSFCDHRLPDR